MLDTNELSELLRLGADQRVIAFIEEQRDPIVCAAVVHELITMDAEIGEISGRLRAGETRSGFALQPIDALIAASAIVASARLATRNIKDFEPLGIELVNPWAH